MLKRLICLAFVAMLSATLLFSGCSFSLKKGESMVYEAEYGFNIAGSADANTISLDITNTESDYEDGQALDVVMLKPYEYYNGERDRGVHYLDTTTAQGETVGQYVVGTEKTIEIDRYETIDNDTLGTSDNLYNKFILALDGKMVAGPFYVNNIESLRNYEQKTPFTTKKGILAQGNDTLLDLGCGYTEYNVRMNMLVYPNEIVNEQGEVVALDNSNLTDADAITYISNGTTYYFRRSAIEEIDSNLTFCRDNNIRAVLILYCEKMNDQYYSPYFMSYPDARDYDQCSIWASDTSTEIGFNYYKAVLEFLAERYSQEDGTYGYAHRFVIGNEIDISWNWNPIYNYHRTEALALNDYVEEYTRLLRLAEQVTKKYYADSMVLVSTCHYWAGTRTGVGVYGSKQLYDYLNAKISYQGNFNWGMAAHPYPIDLSDARYLTSESQANSISGDVDNSIYMTWTNFEILDLYLAREELLYNGQMRRVYLTEGGVSSGSYDSPIAERNLLSQAAGIAYAYYKCMSMECVDAFIYYRMVDASGDGGGCNFGVLTETHEQKPSYQVFKYLDTQYTFDYTNEYLDQLTYRIDGVNYGVRYGNVSTYRDTMVIFESSFDFDKMWSEDKFIYRNV